MDSLLGKLPSCCARRVVMAAVATHFLHNDDGAGLFHKFTGANYEAAAAAAAAPPPRQACSSSLKEASHALNRERANRNLITGLMMKHSVGLGPVRCLHRSS